MVANSGLPEEESDSYRLSPTKSGLTSKLAHAYSPGGITWRSCDKLRISIQKSSFLISRDIMGCSKVCGRLPDRLCPLQ